MNAMPGVTVVGATVGMFTLGTIAREFCIPVAQVEQDLQRLGVPIIESLGSKWVLEISLVEALAQHGLPTRLKECFPSSRSMHEWLAVHRSAIRKETLIEELNSTRSFYRRAVARANAILRTQAPAPAAAPKPAAAPARTTKCKKSK